jgi:hypothetical protein
MLPNILISRKSISDIDISYQVVVFSHHITKERANNICRRKSSHFSSQHQFRTAFDLLSLHTSRSKCLEVHWSDFLRLNLVII